MHKNTQRSKLEYWLALYLIKGIGFQTASKLLSCYNFDQIFCESNKHSLTNLIPHQLASSITSFDWCKVDNLLLLCKSKNIDIIDFSHPFYPEILKETSSPPFVLFCIGDLQLLQMPKLAIVGARNATEIGCRLSIDIGSNLAINDFCVVSGMARGIDSHAHQGALKVNGKTIAVLGTGVDVCYPARSRKLYDEIKQTGLLISEYLPGTKALASNFPRRNRIISGLSVGCVVVEAEQKSGSLISARYALEQNREVFAVPGSVFNKMSKGCHLLIKQGAKLIENCDDIFSELSVLPKNCLYKEDENKKHSVTDSVLAHLNSETTTVDQLQQLTGLTIDELLPRLLDLELSGQVIRVLDGYTRIGRH